MHAHYLHFWGDRVFMNVFFFSKRWGLYALMWLVCRRNGFKRLWLRDLGYRKGLVMGVGSCFNLLETWTSHHNPCTISSNWKLIQRCSCATNRLGWYMWFTGTVEIRNNVCKLEGYCAILQLSMSVIQMKISCLDDLFNACKVLSQCRVFMPAIPSGLQAAVTASGLPLVL